MKFILVGQAVHIIEMYQYQGINIELPKKESIKTSIRATKEVWE